MTEREGPEPGIEARREAAVERLMEHFANDDLEVEEFERRLDVANRCDTAAELDRLLADLPEARTPAVRQADASVDIRPTEMVRGDRVRDRSLIMSVMGGTDRKGRWIPARRSNVIALMGGVALDFREAMMAPGVTEVWIFTMWGGVEIIVPPGLPVEVDGLAILGGFDFDSNEPVDRTPDEPLLRIRGMAVMGGVEVTVRRVGESARDARRRRKLERKERRKRLRSGE